MKLRQFAKKYGLNTRSENRLWLLKYNADCGDIKDNRISKYYDNNIEKVLIIAVKDQLNYERIRDADPFASIKFPMLWRCSGIGRKTITNIMEAVYSYLDDPNTPETIEELRVDPSTESKPTSAVRLKKKVPSINYIHFDMDLLQYCTPKDYESTKSLTFTVTSHTNKKYANSHCAIVLEEDMGADEVVIVEEMPLTQLKRLHKFIEMVFELDK